MFFRGKFFPTGVILIELISDMKAYADGPTDLGMGCKELGTT